MIYNQTRMLAASSWRDQWNEMVMAQSQEQGGNNQEQTDGAFPRKAKDF